MKFKFNRRKLTFRRFTYYLLIATIVISCITNGIFAKFTTESDGGDGARVADFGVVVNISGDLFSTAYSNYSEKEVDDGNGGTLTQETAISNNPTIYTANENTVSVKAKSETKADGKLNNVVAPGTKNDVGISVSVTGTPETDYKLTYNLSEFQTIALYGGYGTIYGLMVPFEDGIVNESNFKELVEDGIYTGSGTTYQTYTKVLETDAFKENADYFKIKDTVILEPAQIYMPIKYYITDNATKTKTALNGSYKIPIMWDMSLFESFDNNTFDGCGNPGFCIGHIGEVTGTQTYNTGVNVNENFNITWEWPYHQTTDTPEELAWCNACDTILGYIAAGKNVVKSNEIEGPYDNNILTSDVDYNIASDVCNYNLDITFDYSITIDQVD